jgi:hypothetical protein
MAGRQAIAEQKLKAAVLKLQNALPADANEVFNQLELPNPEAEVTLDAAGKEIEVIIAIAIDNFSKKHKRTGTVFGTKKWIQASIPFLKMFLSIGKIGSAVPSFILKFPNPDRFRFLVHMDYYVKAFWSSSM